MRGYIHILLKNNLNSKGHSILGIFLKPMFSLSDLIFSILNNIHLESLTFQSTDHLDFFHLDDSFSSRMIMRCWKNKPYRNSTEMTSTINIGVIGPILNSPYFILPNYVSVTQSVWRDIKYIHCSMSQ